MTTTTGKPPKSVTEFMAEFNEPAEDMQAWLHQQRAAYLSISDRSAVDLIGWIAHKMTTSRAGAEAALKWAGVTTS